MFAPDASASFVSWLLAPVSIGLLWLSGHLAFRSLPSACRPLTDLLGALIVLFFTALVCDLFGRRIDLLSLSLGLGLAALAGTWASRRCKRGLPRSPRPTPCGPSLRGLGRELSWAAPCLLAFGSVLVFALHDPLAGWDNIWRWNHLALVIQETGSLSAYPPVSADEFLIYPWCDGIPPLIPLLNLWIYLVSGSTCGQLIAFRLLLELGLTLWVVWQTAHHLWGPKGARFALLALAGSFLYLGSVSIAQETGLAGAALAGLCLLLLEYRRKAAGITAVWCAVAAVALMLMRDYNLLFAPLTLLLLGLAGAPRKHLLAATAALTLGVFWFVRNWTITGNPVFAHQLGGFLPTNEFHGFVMARIQDYFSISARLPVLPLAIKVALLGTAACALPACLGFVRSPALRRTALPLCLAMVGLALLALPSTAGGEIYGLRVAGSALPLLAMAAGALPSTTWFSARPAICLVALFAVDAARRHWFFLGNPLFPPWQLAPERNSTAGLHARFGADPLWRALHASSAGAHIVVDHPVFTVRGAYAGIAVTPIFSPTARALVRTDTLPRSPADLLEQLGRENIRFVVLSSQWIAAYKIHPRLRLLLETRPMGTYGNLYIWDTRLAVPVSKTASSAAPEHEPVGRGQSD